jgi:hypothetical protein
MFHLPSLAYSNRYPSMSDVADILVPVKQELTGLVSNALVYRETGG